MPPKFKVLLYEPMHSRGTDLLREKCEVLYARSLVEKDLTEQVSDVDAVVIRANGAVSRPVIDAARHLRVIGRHGVGLDAIDLKAAGERGIPVVYTPTANTESVAEHFVALALMLAKKIRLADMALRASRWNARYELIGTELFGKTLGVLGFGRIGQQTARICRSGFQMKVIYHDPVVYADAEEELKAERMAMDEVFSNADFISVNLPLVPGTHHCIHAGMIHLMKPTAILINMARGPVWKEDDVVGALREQRIAGAGSDVYEVEPPPSGHPLFAMENFVGTPHMSAHTEEGMIRMSMVAKDVLAVLEGRQPEFPVK